MSPLEQFDRACLDYSQWYTEGRWTFERFRQAIEDAASILFPYTAPKREAASPLSGKAA